MPRLFARGSPVGNATLEALIWQTAMMPSPQQPGRGGDEDCQQQRPAPLSLQAAEWVAAGCEVGMSTACLLIQTDNRNRQDSQQSKLRCFLLMKAYFSTGSMSLHVSWSFTRNKRDKKYYSVTISRWKIADKISAPTKEKATSHSWHILSVNINGGLQNQEQTGWNKVFGLVSTGLQSQVKQYSKSTDSLSYRTSKTEKNILQC